MVLILALLALGTLVGCGNKFTGRWAGAGPGGVNAFTPWGGTGPTITFNADGTWTSSEGLAGRYRADGNTIAVMGTVLGTETSQEGYLAGNQLKLGNRTYVRAYNVKRH